MTIHFAGLKITVDGKMRQRCAWCGKLLIDVDLERVAVPVDQPGEPATWLPGTLVEVLGNASWAMYEYGTEGLPKGACIDTD